MSATNTHRLGGHEAPPAIISSFLGTQLSKVLDHLEESTNDDLVSLGGKQGMKLDIPQIPELLIDNTDRNRTSPLHLQETALNSVLRVQKLTVPAP